MQVKKIAFFECDKKRQAYFSEHLSGFELEFYADKLGEQHVPSVKDCQIISVINYSPVTRNIIEQLPETKLIAVGCTGFNNVDLKVCEEHGILVTNTPGYSDDAVAEHTVSLMLMLLRHAHTALLRAKDNQFSWKGIRGRQLKDKTLGIIGTGKIGLKVIELARGFGMNVLAYSRNQKTEVATKLGFSYAPLEKVLAGSDIISLHLAATQATYHFINQERLLKVKPGAFFINTSRGEVCDTKALIWGLDQGLLRGVALDVLEDEKICQENRVVGPDITAAQLETYALNQHLLRRDDVLITPHIGWFTEEAITDMLSIHLDTILAFIQGNPCHVVGGRKG
ncbi:hypothetical protein P22_0883 [Propionispora sp. 2/2-37]|uniref:NAD(P)-dependent oxidoreductase n=1 Tax=Propionispora sp. 2/2-37 TaxID=1677858 RepID=UPI0006BB5876|nr:NAD(P)-dependent oxidoreductase [Propionispora sp. 2/2-37]CUH94817.1 hypothetical protein P22_0883 [Propionispora sp. 2/2-37]